MIGIPWILLILSTSLLAQPVIPLSRIKLAEVSRKKPSLVHSSDKFRLFLTNGFCDESKRYVNLTKEEVAENLDYYQNEMPELISQFESLVKELSPKFFVKNPEIYPIDVHLSLDGHEGCYNATAAGNHIEVPAQATEERRQAVFGLLYHEIGHAMSSVNGFDQNIFDETVADAISLLLYDSDGIFYFGAKEERKDWRRQIQLGLSDPHALASELEIEYTSVPEWIKENRLKYKCSSDYYYRDMRRSVPLSDILKGGGESYIVSCAFHSYLTKLGLTYGKEHILKTFLKKYLKSPKIFNEVDIYGILLKVFPSINHLAFDPSVARLLLIPVEENITMSLNHFEDDGTHYRLSWDHERLNRDWGVVAFKDTDGKSLASFSLINNNNSAVLSLDTQESCEENGLVCFCPDNKEHIRIQFAWMTRAGARTQEMELKLPQTSSECFEIGILPSI